MSCLIVIIATKLPHDIRVFCICSQAKLRLPSNYKGVLLSSSLKESFRVSEINKAAKFTDFMYFLLYFVLVCLATCCGLTQKDVRSHCDVLKLGLESSLMSVEITKRGFHRDVVSTVELSPVVLSEVQVLLVYRWPRGVYVDPYQLASLSDLSDWRILLDSAINIEDSAHKSAGFITFVFPSTSSGATPRLTVTVPIHIRYHKPSFEGQTFTSVTIEHPELLLRTDTCSQLSSVEPHTVIDAPCTADNSSTCSWVKLQQQQDGGPLSVQVPVGNGSLVTAVCGGTLLVTMLCCVALSKYMWKHRVS